MTDSSRALTIGVLGAVIATTTTACLPIGDPPSGRQVVTGRENQLASIAPPNGDGVLRILYFRPGAEAETRDLYSVSVAPDGTPSPERLLVTGLDLTTDLGCLERLPPCSIDPSGWTWVYSKDGGYGSAVGINTITGERKQMDPSTWSLPSPSGQRMVVLQRIGADPNSTEASATLYEPDGSTLTFDLVFSAPQSYGYQFYGEDFYYLTPQATLMHIPPAGAPEQVATGVAGFSGYPTPDGALLILPRPTSDPEVFDLSVLDPVTGLETPLPFDSGRFASYGDIQVSPDGRQLLLSDHAGGRFIFLDPRTGAQQFIAYPDGFMGVYGYAWRPGTSQIWLTSWQGDTPTVRIVSLDAPTITVPRVWMAGFVGDGTYWLSSATSLNNTYPVLQVGPTDDPTGQRHYLTPFGTYLNKSWPLDDGRLLMAVFAKDQDRSDIMATDLATGDSSLLAEHGRMITVGKTRFIGQFHFGTGVGDLTVVELATGRQTILALERAVTAFPEPQGDDLVAPGTRVVYQFEARSDSPYDGIWVTTVP